MESHPPHRLSPRLKITSLSGLVDLTSWTPFLQNSVFFSLLLTLTPLWDTCTNLLIWPHLWPFPPVVARSPFSNAGLAALLPLPISLPLLPITFSPPPSPCQLLLPSGPGQSFLLSSPQPPPHSSYTKCTVALNKPLSCFQNFTMTCTPPTPTLPGIPTLPLHPSSFSRFIESILPPLGGFLNCHMLGEGPSSTSPIKPLTNTVHRKVVSCASLWTWRADVVPPSVIQEAQYLINDLTMHRRSCPSR